MSKRSATTQGGEDRYGMMGGQSGTEPGDDRPRTATAAQLARRKILSTKGASTPGGSNRSSRAASPVKAGPGLFSQPQAFQPPSSANSFTFSMGGSQPPPTFGQTPQPNGNSFGTPSQGQPQQNGSMSFGGFGNAQQGTTLSFGAGFGAASTSAQSQPNTFNPSTSINFGQSQPNPTDPSASFQFGQTQNLTQPQTNGSQPSAGGVLGTSFGSQQPQQNGAKPSFSFGQPQPTKEQAPAPSTLSFGGFGQSAQQNGNKPGGTASFGQSVPVQSGTGLLSSSPASETPKNGDSVFSALKPTTNGFKPGMFTQSVPNGDQTPKPFSFGQKEQAATKPASTFTFGQSTPHEGFPPDTEQTPKPAASSFAANFQSQDKPNPSPAVGSGASPSQDASMMSLDTPQKPVSILDGSSEHVQAANPNAGKDLFSRLSPADPPATVPRPSVISAAPSGQASQGMGVARSEEKADAGKDLFSRISRPEPPATEPRPSSIAFPQTATSSVLSAPSFSQAKTTSTSAAPVQQVPAASTTPSTASPDFGKITQLNESLLKHLTTQDPGKDWSVICHYYLTEAAKYCGGDAIPPPPPAVTSNEPRPQASSMTAHVKTPKAPATNMFSQQASSTNLFKPQTPAPSTDPRLRKRGADEQLTKKDSDLSVPATEKRIKPTEPVQYPKLPESASNTAKLFASALDKPVEKSTGGTSFGLAPPPWNAPMTGTKPMGQADDQSGNASMFGPPEDVMAKVREQKAAKEAAERAAANETPAPAPSTTFTPSTTVKFGVAAPAASPAEPVEAPKAPTFGFTPSTSTTNTTGFKPPTSSASSAGGSTNFLAAFGQKANADEEEARKRRREEDYDSEEEDEATWLARDKAEQAEKRRKIEEAARRGSSFSAASATSTASFLSAFGQKANADEEKARKRRWDEDHDSDEEDKATWLARDKAEQAEKRRKIEEAAKSGPSFKLPASADKPAASSTPVAFQPPGAETPAETDSSANAGKSLFDRLGPREETAETSSVNAGKSLFDRLGPRDETSAQPSLFSSQAGQPVASGFGFSKSKAPVATMTVEGEKTQGEKSQGVGDSTWKPNTPIKFGQSTATSTTPAAPPPANPFAGLFGAASTKDSSKLAPPTMGFGFGQTNGASGPSMADGSRATTPGAEAGEGTEQDDEQPDEQPDEQVEDMTDLLPEELEAEEVMARASMAKASKFDEKNTEEGMKKTWVERGRGPLYVLKNRSTGKVRILLKVPPLGRPAMNFEPLKGVEYTNPRPKYVAGPFIDHLEMNKEKAQSIRPWQIQVRDAVDAPKIAKALMDGRPL